MTFQNTPEHRAALVRRSAGAVVAGALLSGALLFPALASAEPRIADNDSDGVPDIVEASKGTSNFTPDTDGDGLRDFDEINLFFTNPTAADSDGDGVDDKAETFAKTNPNVADSPEPEPAAAGGDSDGDGLSDQDELRFFTNLFLADTDFDGVSDGDEIKNQTNPLNLLSN